MNEFGDSDGSNSNPSDRNNEEEVCYENKCKTSASSSSSIAEEREKKLASSRVRQYVRSKVPRLRWTPDLHLRFLQAVERLGGHETEATPKLVLQLMNIRGLNIAHVKSHLQMYRSKKIDNQGQAMNGRSCLTESADGLVCNFWQPPLFDKKFRADFRYKDGPWCGHGSWMSSRSCIKNGTNFSTGTRFHIEPFYINNSSTLTVQNSRTTHEDLRLQTRSTFIEPSLSAWQWHENEGENVNCFKVNSNILDGSWSTNGGDQKHNKLKRKAQKNDLLDLSLSLMSTKSRKEEAEEMAWVEEVDSNLSLSLYYCSEKQNPYVDLNYRPSKVSRLKQDEENSKNLRLTSTLDLTI